MRWFDNYLIKYSVPNLHGGALGWADSKNPRRRISHMPDIVSKTYEVVTSKRYDVVYFRHRMSWTRCRIIQDDDVVYIVHDVMSLYFLYVRHRVLGHDVVT